MFLSHVVAPVVCHIKVLIINSIKYTSMTRLMELVGQKIYCAVEDYKYTDIN